MNNAKVDLAKLKMEKALEAWEEALWCFQGGKYPATVNRLYYAAYRACLAVLSFESNIPVKHSAVIGRVNRVFVKEGLLPKEVGRFLHGLQTARVEGKETIKVKTSQSKKWKNYFKAGK